MKYCPCCTEQLLRHVNREGIYWYCSRCRQKMPILQKHQLEPKNLVLEEINYV